MIFDRFRSFLAFLKALLEILLEALLEAFAESLATSSYFHDKSDIYPARPSWF